MEKNLAIIFIAISLITVAAAEACDKCVPKEKCLMYGKMNQQAQDAWQEKFPCSAPQDKGHSKIFGFAPNAKGDYVCCSNAIWGTAGNTESTTTSSQSPNVNSRHGDYNNNFANRAGNNGNVNQGGQCPLTSFPPAPETGCCGHEATDADRIIGGRETELEQFPWTVLLTVTFDYGDKRSAFNCGGSLISSRYVLTAGHCVYDEGGKIIDVDVYLAEYDKRTFPKDCKNVLGQGQKCIENVVMKAEDVVLHPQYEDSQLQNDIALIRLQGNAPYTDYIRPICLPSIDIDTPTFSNLRLGVAGWGRNGQYRSDVKQSTVVNLVPQDTCKKDYPNLSRRNICAAGHTGEDTCKGDSGGPLMTVYGGSYEVVGVVSGKRADSPCGTSVPSLYTSVFHYLDWIRHTIKN